MPKQSDPSASIPVMRLQQQAARTVAHVAKSRARYYARHPMALETLYPGLACASAEKMIVIAAHLLDRSRRAPARWIGAGGEVTALNARAALILGRTLRRHHEREEI